ncbi:peptidyl-tRNA hydrolase domain-containing protein [Mytilinidion resinicola]|uniref:Peptidyl-tRNA hydrolase domain-containing protein n=1 Tax=Mytilinidion resinicola TaxID=574789 RepID=A0A6A6Z1L6_9PEZI|nr:peptidyl-tRNA hydrolase domain-containing protein [Mytilinidion resinicola]KAF2814619.1 peptidyl-tRNA hydrolase domain-containing protein [Mytilinidion resinicola]
MLRCPARPFVPLASAQSLLLPAALRLFASQRLAGDATADDIQAARRWLEKLDPDTIPKAICDLSFSRSSGPGGQNVNKVNSKATLKLEVNKLLAHVPSLLHFPIRSSRYYAPRSNSIIIQADDSRKQNDNTHSCFAKLHNLIVEAGREALPGQTSPEQSRRVKNLQKSENEHRLKAKKMHSSKKSTRRASGNSD